MGEFSGSDKNIKNKLLKITFDFLPDLRYNNFMKARKENLFL
jgi:hypothetical protein